MRFFAIFLALALTSELAGQQPTEWRSGSQTVQLWSARAGAYLFVSDRPLGETNLLVAELEEVKERFARDLGLRPRLELVRFYFFHERRHFEAFTLHYLPYLKRGQVSSRHGLYLQREGTPHVFVLASERLRHSVRHEMSHVLLNAAVPHAPIWLDEGLACFMEDDAEQAARAAKLVRGSPDVRRLERLKSIEQMGPREYAEASLLVLSLLEGGDEGNARLRSYLR